MGIFASFNTFKNCNLGSKGTTMDAGDWHAMKMRDKKLSC